MISELEKQKIVIEKNGKEVECDVLFTFDSEDTLKSYIGYTDNTVTVDGRKNIYVSSFDPLSPVLKLDDIEDEMELEMIQDVLRQLDENANSNN